MMSCRCLRFGRHVRQRVGPLATGARRDRLTGTRRSVPQIEVAQELREPVAAPAAAAGAARTLALAGTGSHRAGDAEAPARYGWGWPAVIVVLGVSQPQPVLDAVERRNTLICGKRRFLNRFRTARRPGVRGRINAAVGVTRTDDTCMLVLSCKQVVLGLQVAVTVTACHSHIFSLPGKYLANR